MASFAVNETYRSVEGLLYSVVWKFHRAKGGDVDDLLGIAHEAYVDAYDTYDPDRGEFETWVVNKIHYRMLEDWRKRCVRHRALPRCEVNFDLMACGEKSPLDGLSEQAREVVEMVLTSDPRVTSRVAGRSRHPWRAALADVLVEAGWTVKQVAEAFAEVQEALS